MINRILLFWLAGLFCFTGPLEVAQAQTATVTSPYVVATIADLKGGHFFPSASTTSGVTVTVQGYSYPGDGGGGVLVSAPVSAVNYPKGTCMTAQGTFVSSNQLQMQSAVPVGLTAGMTIQELDPPSLPIPVGTVQSYDALAGTITFIPSGSASGTNVPLAFGLSSNPAHSGSYLDVDNYCYTRANSTWSQREWGAFSNNNTNATYDDTDALQSWINANQPHIAVPGTSIISAPLFCGTDNTGATVITPNDSIEGSPPLAEGESAAGTPIFNIEANSSTFSTTNGKAVLIMPPGVRCAIHGVGIIANSGAGAGHYDAVDITGQGTVDRHSLLTGGYYNLYTAGGNGGGTGTQANTEVYDSAMNKSFSANLLIQTDNVKIARNAFSNAGQGKNNNATANQDNILIRPDPVTNGNNPSDVMIVDNSIQNANGWGLSVQSSHLIRATGNYFDNNGYAVQGTGGVEINNSGNVTLCGNTFHRTGAATEGIGATPTPTSHIMFDGTADDSISLCGNVYLPAQDSAVIGVRPDYVYDAYAGVSGTPGTLLTNISIADNGGAQNNGLYTGNALQQLGNAASPHVPQNYISGLTLSNGTSSVVNIAAGEATDSTGKTIISLPNGCPVDLTKSGLGGVDLPPATPSTTYFIYTVSLYGGANPSCIASKSLIPSFTNVGTYQIAQQGSATAGSPVIFNVGGPFPGGLSKPAINPLAGVEVGDPIVVSSGTGTVLTSTISSLASYFYPNNLSGSWSSTNPSYITNITASLPTNLALNMLVGAPVNASTSNPPISPATIVSICTSTTSCVAGSGANCYPVTGGSGTCLTLSSNLCQPTPASCSATTVNFVIGGNYTITLPTNFGATASPASLAIYEGHYRLLGALYTTSATSPTVVPFTQYGNTFYLQTPAADINSASIGTSFSNISLASVPQGVSVEALGRCVATSTGTSATYTLVSPVLPAGAPPPSPPTFFPTVPGYGIRTYGGLSISAPETAIPYRIFTNTSSQIMAQASASATLNCMTDGWVFNRSP